MKFQKKKKTEQNDLLPNQLAKAIYCILWAWIGISFAISWCMIGKNGGQFLSLEVMPAEIPCKNEKKIELAISVLPNS